MNLTDTLISLALVGLVLRQLRERPLTAVSLLWPLPLVLYAALTNLRTLPSGAGLDFTLLLGLVGLGLGLLCGLLTRVYAGRDGVLARATGLAAALWVLGVGSRLAFAFYAEHGGGAAIARLSGQLHLTQSAWTAGLLLMSLLEVLGRSAALFRRRARVERGQLRPGVHA